MMIWQLQGSTMTVLLTAGARLAVLAILTFVGKLLRNLKYHRNPVLSRVLLTSLLTGAN